MDKISLAVVWVPAKVAQAVRKNLEEQKLWDDSRKLLRNGETVAIPVHNRQPQLSVVLQIWPEAEVKECHLPPSAKCTWKNQGQKLKASVQSLLIDNKLSEALLLEVPKKWEKHGDLIILPASAFISSQWCQLGEELWLTVASALGCKRLAQHSHVADDGFRSPQVSMLLGHDGKVVHIDNGIRCSFDVTKCMFSSGNISEKLRVASWDCSKETVVDLYAGIGYFTLPYLVHAKACHVHACEWNPDAVAALRNNLALNGAGDRCTVYEGDNRKLKLLCVADRVNLGLIPSSEDGWPVAVRVLKRNGGVLHIHANVTKSAKVDGQPTKDQGSGNCIKEYRYSNLNPSCPNSETETYKNGCHEDGSTSTRCSDECQSSQDETNLESGVLLKNSLNGVTTKPSVYNPWVENTRKKIEGLLEKEKGGGWLCEVLHIEKVKSYAPHIDHVVLDLKCKPTVTTVPFALGLE